MSVYPFVFSSALFMVLAGCNAQIYRIAPFPDRPTEIYSLRYTALNVTGIVWSFDDDGMPVNFGGPVGLVHENTTEPAVSVSGAHFDFSTTVQVTSQDPDEIKGLIVAVETFCMANGYARYDASGANLYSNNGLLHFINFCGPERKGFE